MSEELFRAHIRKLVREGRYPEHKLLLGVRRRDVSQMRSGLSADESRWRRQEIEAAGFDWEASKRARSLVRKAGR